MKTSKGILALASALAAVSIHLPMPGKAATSIIVDPEPNNLEANETIALFNRDVMSIGGSLGQIRSQAQPGCRRCRTRRDRQDLYAFSMVAPSQVSFNFATVQPAEGHTLQVRLVQDDNRNRRIDSGETTIAVIDNRQPKTETLAAGDYIMSAKFVSPPTAVFSYDLLVERLDRLD